MPRAEMREMREMRESGENREREQNRHWHQETMRNGLTSIHLRVRL